MLDPYSDSVLWIVIVGFVIAFILAFGIGANDVANSFGTSVGAKVLTVRQACYLATVFEIAGAILIGYKVSDTMRKGILDVAVYEDFETEFMLGLLSSLISSAAWMMIATFLKLPISGTHSIVGATVGFSLVARGLNGIRWSVLGTVIASWFISPLMSGLVSVVIFMIIRKGILHTEHPLLNGYKALPVFYGVTVFINVFSIVHDGPKLLYMDRIPLWGALLAGFGAGLIAAILAWLLLVPHGSKNKSIIQDNSRPNFTMGSHNISPVNSPVQITEEDVEDVSTLKKPQANEWHTPLTTVSECIVNEANPNENDNQKHLNNGKSISDKNKALLASTEDCNSVLSTSVSPPKTGFIQKELMDHNVNCLNNVDLTVTSLRYIDDTVSFSKSVDSNPCELANSYDSNRSSYLRNFGDGIVENHKMPTERHDPPSHLKQLFQNPKSRSLDAENGGVPEYRVSIQVPHEINGNKPHKDHRLLGHRMSTGSIAIAKSIVKLQSVQSGVSLVDMNPSLTPNSSAVPLILADKMKRKNTGEKKPSRKRIGIHGAEEEMRSGIGHLFSFLQVLTATFGSFAHGGNDVSNAIGPIVGIWLLYKEGSAQQQSETPLLILFYGGIGISFGLWLWGRRVIQTVGEDLTEITPSTGFTIEIGAALTVLLASKIGLPISTTHCKVGSVVFVGYSKGKSDGVDWKIFRNIIFAWVVTVPIAALISAFCMFVLQKFTS